jgi:hypothetical protein
MSIPIIELIKNISDRQLLQRIGAVTPKSFLESPYLRETVKNSLVVDAMFDKSVVPGYLGRYQEAAPAFQQAIVIG